MEPLPTLVGALMAVALGGLVGLEREFGKEVEKRKLLMGLRTSILLCLLGYLSVIFQEFMDLNISIVLGFIASLVALSLSYLSRAKIYKITGITTFVAGILVFVVGLILGFGEYLTAVVLAVVVTCILAARKEFHVVVSKMSRSELISAIKFSIIAFVILPLLQQYPVTLFDILSLYDFWLIVVVISLIQFASFILVRVFEGKGNSVVGFFGGFINSNATTYTIAEQSGKSNTRGALSSIFLSNLAMMMSTIVISFVIFPSLESLQTVLVILIPSMLFVLFVSLRYLEFKGVKAKIKSPYSLVSALKFATALFGLTIIVNYFAGHYSHLVLLTSFLVGLASSTPMIASLSLLMASGSLEIATGAHALCFAAMGSLMSKNFWARAGNNTELSKKMLLNTTIASLLILGMTLL